MFNTSKSLNLKLKKWQKILSLLAPRMA
jgi:hypothetical protein